MGEILFKAEAYKIIGICLEVYNTLGFGFQEIVYKDAMVTELTDSSPLYEKRVF